MGFFYGGLGVGLLVVPGYGYCMVFLVRLGVRYRLLWFWVFR